MRYLLDLSKVILFMLIMYLPLSWWSFQESIKTSDQFEAQKTYDHFFKVQHMVSSILKKNDLLEACQKLDAEISAQNITTYLIIGPENSCYKPAGFSQMPPVTHLDQPENFVVHGIPYTFYKSQTGPYGWAVSVLTPQKTNILKRMKQNPALRNDVIKDILLVVYTVISFIFLAVLILAKSIQNKFRKNGQDPLWLKLINVLFGWMQLHDLKILRAGTEALIHENADLNKDIDLLETSLEYSILNEIKTKNIILPYTFYGTVAKVDINGFSKVVSSGDSLTTQDMTLRLEDFGCELLQRYEGLFEKTIGDEIVVVFKGDDAALRAAAFSRDLMQAFSKIKFQLAHEERQFTLKSAIYSSDITFSKRSAGYGFLGDALTFTTRLMDAVDVKDRNVLSITKDMAAHVQSLTHLPAQTRLFEFKNMAPQEGYLITSFLTLDACYQSINPNLTYYRSDDAVLMLLHQITVESSLEKTNLILDALMKINVRVSHVPILDAWLAVVKNHVGLRPNQLSKLIMVGVKLIPVREWQPKATAALLEIPRDLDGRVNASIIDVLMQKDIEALKLLPARSFLIANDPSGRTLGNILVFKALLHLNNLIIEDLIKMVRSTQVNTAKSGMYAACQIITYYRKHNPAVLVTLKSYKSLVGLLVEEKRNPTFEMSERLNARLADI